MLTLEQLEAHKQKVLHQRAEHMAAYSGALQVIDELIALAKGESLEPVNGQLPEELAERLKEQ